MATRLALAIVLFAGSGCASDQAVGALLNVGLAATAAGVSRAHGGCYASCPPGTTCNTATGLCDQLPCRGQCGHGQRCDQSGPIEHCALDKPGQLQIDRPVDQTGLLQPSAPPAPPPGQ